MNPSTVTVVGGSGFLGQNIVQHLTETGYHVRVACRHPNQTPFGEAVYANVKDETSIAAAVKNSQAVVNAVGLYVEHGGHTFDSIHIQGAQTVAQQSAKAGVQRLIHISGIGASATSASKYVRARAAGEDRVQTYFPGTVIIRPSVLFGPHDSLLNTIDKLTCYMPAFPLFGRGDTRLQPVYVKDVARAIQSLLKISSPPALYELGGLHIHSYRELIEMILHYRQRQRLLLPVPFFIWTLQARLLSWLPNPPITVDQLVLMRNDNIVGQQVATFADLGLKPHAIEPLLSVCLGVNRGNETI